MQRAAVGICRRLLGAIITSGAAAKERHEPTPGERNTGRKDLDVVGLFGPAGTLRRTYYYDSDRKSGHYPLDERMGLVGRYTPALVEEVLRVAADKPYGQAAAEFSRTHYFDMSADTIREIVEKVRHEATSFVKLSDLGAKEDAGGRIDTVYVLVDGTGLPFRRSSLRGVRGKNGKAKTREAKLGVIFIGGTDSGGNAFRLSDTTTYVATTHRWSKFMKLLDAEFRRRFGRPPRRVVFISDGGKWITSVRNNIFPQSVFVLDFFHAVEHLEPVMLALGLRKGTKEWKRKLRYWCRRMKEGKIQSIIDAAEKARPDSREMRKALKYFKDNKERMRYDQYLADGLFIASGVVESGCKTVLGERLKRSGMFWSLKGAKGMIPLRTLKKSGRLEEFFNYRLRNLRQTVYCRPAG